MITLALKAAEKIREHLDKNPATPFLRLAAVGGGCSGFQYQMTLEKAARPDDLQITVGEIKILIDPRSQPFLRGVRLDYVEGLTGSGFRFDNPNASGSCGCGESFTV